MRKYIEMNALIEFANNHKEGKIDSNDISRFPTADVVEVTRCENCKHYELMKANNQYFCNEFGGFVHSDDYCSRNSW